MSAASGSRRIILTVGGIKPIVRPQVIEPNEIHPASHSISYNEQRGEAGSTQRFVSFLPDFLIYAVSTTIDSPVLSSEDGPNGSLILDVSREPGDLWDDDNNLGWR